MNSGHNSKTPDRNIEKLKDIPRWTRKYAQNRTLTVMVLLGICVLYGVLAALLFGLALSFAAISFKKGNIFLGCLGICFFVVILAAMVKFHIIVRKKFGGKNKGLLDQIIDRWVYGKEGTASMPLPKLFKSKKAKRLDVILAVVYLVLLIGTMELGMLGYIPVKYFLPFTALFVVPFGIYQYFIMQPRLGPVLFIFPILYTIHAILILAGVPIFFTGSFAVPLNMLVPIIYNFLAYIIGHLYSRYALKKLRDITYSHGGDES